MTEIFWRDFIFSDATADIENASGSSHQSLIAEGLEADNFDFTAFFNAGWLNGYYVPNPSAYADYLTAQGEVYCVTNGTGGGQDESAFESWEYAEPVRLYNDGVFIAEYYLTNIAPILSYPDGTVKYAFECLSFVGLMVEMTHVGGVYENAKVGDVLAEILQATQNAVKSTTVSKWYDTEYGIHYTVDTKVANARVDGYLPYADGTRTARDNVRDVLFQCGASILKNADGSLRFTALEQESPVGVADTDIYIGDKYGQTQRVTDVGVVEHAYYKIANDPVVLYDTGADFVTDLRVIFGNPVYALDYPDTMNISEWGSNYAIITGLGVLRGNLYTHTQQLFTKKIANGTQNQKTADIPLVSPLNYLAVLNRMERYFKNAREVKMSLVLNNGIKTGSFVLFNDPLNRQKTGYIKDTVFNMSSIVKADTTVIVGWTPQNEAGFEHSVLLTGSGTWSLPAGVDVIRVVLIGGGKGGFGGMNGTSPTEQAGREAQGSETYSDLGRGGVGGNYGLCGKAFSVTIENPATSFSYACGVGGNGGASNGGEGQDGTATTFGAYSSENGGRPSAGIVDLITGEIYCLPTARAGFAGADGGTNATTGKFWFDDPTTRSASGQDFTADGQTWFGGLGGFGDNRDWTNEEHYLNGGNGGGACYGGNGQNGQDYPYGSSGAGRGGNGGNAIPLPDTPTYGQAGTGGNGGGGGGHAGVSATKKRNSRTDPWVFTGYWRQAGTGGNGSAGGKGGDGCVLVYY